VIDYSPVSITTAESAKDECYRCGYELRSIGDEQACPECGLLAQRSRRATDELHNSRPRWLRSLSIGINLILLSIATPFIWPLAIIVILPFLNPLFRDGRLFFVGFDAAALLLFLGIILLTRKEEYPPADAADRRLRNLLRAAGMVAVVGMVVVNLAYEFPGPFPMAFFEFMPVTLLLLFVAIPLLLFLRLRGLARRVRSAHLAEHCIIVGIGASLSVVYFAVAIMVLVYAQSLGLDPNWDTTSKTSLLVQLLMGVAGGLFLLWSLYLLVRFAVAFRIAARQLRGKWVRDDRALAEVPAPPNDAR
jgi:hypothetical protein